MAIASPRAEPCRVACLRSYLDVHQLTVVAAALSTLVAAPAIASADACEDGLAAAAAGEHARAYVALDDCLAGEPSAAVRDRATDARRAVKRELDRGDYAVVTIHASIEDQAVEVVSLGSTVVTPRELYLPFGSHLLRAARDGYEPVDQLVEVDARVRMQVVVELARLAQSGAQAPGAAELDFSDETPAPTIGVADPRPKEHESLIPSRFGSGPAGAAPPEQARPRWPWFAGAAGVLAVAGGIAAHASGRKGLAIGLYIGGAAALGAGAIGLATAPRGDPDRSARGVPAGSVLTVSVGSYW